MIPLGEGYMHADKGRAYITAMTCAACGNKLAPFDKGAECRHCKRWPLCATCARESCDAIARDHK